MSAYELFLNQRKPLKDSPYYIDLQFFAKPEDEGKTEEASEQKIRKSREEGKVAKSNDLSGVLVLLFTFLTLVFFGGYFIQSALKLFKVSFTKNLSNGIDLNTSYLFKEGIKSFLTIMWPIFIIAPLIGLAANFAQVGFYITTKPLEPKFDKIMPKIGQWFSKSFLSTEALFNLFKSSIRILLIFGMAILFVYEQLQTIISLSEYSLYKGMFLFLGIAVKIIFITIIFLLGLSLVDLYFQRKQFKDSLKMSKQELKEERKDNDGDPLLKSKQKERMREILRSTMLKDVVKADVVITNPTHYAVALQWDSEKMIAPAVVAKGVDNLAFRIREIAEENNITIMENKPLARALYATVEIGEGIPQEYWELVSKILAEVYKLNNKF